MRNIQPPTGVAVSLEGKLRPSSHNWKSPQARRRETTVLMPPTITSTPAGVRTRPCGRGRRTIPGPRGQEPGRRQARQQTDEDARQAKPTLQPQGPNGAAIARCTPNRKQRGTVTKLSITGAIHFWM